MNFNELHNAEYWQAQRKYGQVSTAHMLAIMGVCAAFFVCMFLFAAIGL